MVQLQDLSSTWEAQAGQEHEAQAEHHGPEVNVPFSLCLSELTGHPPPVHQGDVLSPLRTAKHQTSKSELFIPPFQNVGHFSFALCQTSLALARFIEKYINIYNTK